MPSIKQNQEAGQQMVNSGAIVPASLNTNNPLPIPVTVTTYPAAPNPNLRGPLPASYVQQPDMQRQWQNAAVNQTRVPPSPSTSNPVVGAQAVSQTITIVQGGGGGGGTVLLTNGVKNTVQSTLNLISAGGIILSADSLGGVTISATGFVVLNPTSAQTISGAPLILASTTPLQFQGATSGSTTLQASAVASGTLTLPAATDTLVGKNTTDTLTNKTLTTPIINGATTGTGIQGTDSKLLTSGTISGTGATLCTDAQGGATTSGCSGSSFVIQTIQQIGGLCNTGGGSNSACTDALVWPSPFASTAYSVTCTGVQPNAFIGQSTTNQAPLLVISSYTVNGVTVITETLRSTAAQFDEIHCIGVHP